MSAEQLKLLGCPFCGEDKAIAGLDRHTCQYYVRCTGCGIECVLCEDGHDQWNRRAPAQQGGEVGMRDAIVGALDGLYSPTSYGNLPAEHDDQVIERLMHAVRPLVYGDAVRCPHCDNTGDVHDATGEWRGVCKP